MTVNNKKSVKPGTSISSKGYDGIRDVVKIDLHALEARVKEMPEGKEKKNLWTAIENLYNKTFEAFGGFAGAPTSA